ncbi:MULTISPECIES: hypothetical protein [Pseudomonas syringae group]|uniref:Uncharacterized protein n=2 Tax=Pseudomonas syringae group TaxID=136849 RepID=A0ABX6HDM3_9PSED|nr:hypothetical protein [Pseudomonas asturiensis]QHF03645.1 hypothetical protein N015_15000 [Pseudomonas asturiensis]
MTTVTEQRRQQRSASTPLRRIIFRRFRRELNIMRPEAPRERLLEQCRRQHDER